MHFLLVIEIFSTRILSDPQVIHIVIIGLDDAFMNAEVGHCHLR